MKTALPNTVAVLVLVFASACGERDVSFSADVMPILEEHCANCHTPGGEGYEASGFSVASYQDIMAGTSYGSVIKPGSAFDSTLVILIEGRADHAIDMPREGARLTDREIETIKRWIDQGADDT